MDHGVVADAFAKHLQFFFVGQIAVNQQVRDFDKVAVGSQFFDSVATITQHAFFAV